VWSESSSAEVTASDGVALMLMVLEDADAPTPPSVAAPIVAVPLMSVPSLSGLATAPVNVITQLVPTATCRPDTDKAPEPELFVTLLPQWLKLTLPVLSNTCVFNVLFAVTPFAVPSPLLITVKV
jgi:hypothetical protein